MQGLIYGLTNPLDNNKVFYVGQTTKFPINRLKIHITQAKHIKFKSNTKSKMLQ